MLTMLTNISKFLKSKRIIQCYTFWNETAVVGQKPKKCQHCQQSIYNSLKIRYLSMLTLLLTYFWLVNNVNKTPPPAFPAPPPALLPENVNKSTMPSVPWWWSCLPVTAVPAGLSCRSIYMTRA